MPCRRPRLPIVSVVAAAAVSLCAAGCGGGGAPGVAGARSSTTGTGTIEQTGLLAYSRCMRSHGVPTFPDPDGSGGIPKAEIVALANDPRLGTASKACLRLMPPGGLGPPATAQQTSARAAGELSFARCMRNHGVTNFPDPTAQGKLTVAMIQAQGIDLRSPALLRVAQICVPASHGAITAANVSEALEHAGG